MAKISKIRIINFVYNENRHIYDQTLDFFQGEDALLNLQNGGGKTVLVQMMMQPMVPKLKLKDRVFKSYFANSKAPCYIMIEWIVDSQMKKVMTGIGVKRIAGKNTDEESNSLKVVTFLSEYEQGSKFDIKNIELLEEERGIIRLLEFDKVIRNLSSAEKEGEGISVYRWELPDDKREYNRRLQEYKINPAEWKNLMVKINESEAGLNSFFNDCKTSNALIKKWFLPTVEEQLNKNGNSIEVIKELIRNHAIQRVRNEAMMKEREVFEAFQTKSEGLAKQLQDQGERLEAGSRCRKNLGNAGNAIEVRLKVLEREKDALFQAVREEEANFNKLEYERMSREYQQTAKSLEELCIRQAEYECKIEEEVEDARELDYKRRLMTGLSCREELKSLNEKIAAFEAELEKENLKQEDQRDRIEDISYSLKEIYKERLEKSGELVSATEQELIEAKNRKAEDTGRLLILKEALSSLQKERIAVSSRIAVFKEREKELKETYPDIWTDSLFEEEDPEAETEPIKEKLLEEEKESALQKDELNKEIEDLKEALLKAEIQKEQNTKKQQELAVERSREFQVKQAFEEKKSEIAKILYSYQIGEEFLYDKERIEEVLHREAESYNRLIQETALENSILSKQRKQYEAEGILELPQGLAKVLEDNGIFVEYGYDWLKNLLEDKREKAKLVRNNPFLPASLIVSGKDMDRIRTLEFEGTLPSFLPVLEREKLKDILAVKSGKNVYTVGGAKFLVTYDDRLLNKNYLKELTEEITLKIDRNDKTIATAREALKNTEIAILRVEGFSYTREEANGFDESLKATEAALQTNEEALLQIQNRMDEWKEQLAVKGEKIRKLTEVQSFLHRRQVQVLQFLDKQEARTVDQVRQRQLEEEEKKQQHGIKTIQETIEKTNEQIRELEGILIRLKTEMEGNERNFILYRNTNPAKRLYEEPETLESRLKVLISDTTGKIQNLEVILKDYRIRREEKQREITGLGILEEAFSGKEYKAFELKEVLKDLEESKEKQAELKEERDHLRILEAGKTSDLKYVLRMIKDRCGYETALPMKEIRNVDFEQVKKESKGKIKELEKELMLIKKQGEEMEKVLLLLEEYKCFGDKEEEFILPDHLREWVQGQIQDNRKIEQSVLMENEKLSSLYVELESEFAGKSDMFKVLFGSILEGEKRYHPTFAINALERVSLQIIRKIKQHSIDLKKIDDMENGILDNTLSYLKNVYDEMSILDKNSVIDIDGRRCKMLLIELPEKESLDQLALKGYLKDTILKCETIYKQEKSPENLLLNDINTYSLFDRLAGMNKIHINLMKIEPNRLKKKSWKQVIEETSGGEKFVSAFVVFISLLTYMRNDIMPGDSTQSKVLIMDNPFGPITSEHLLKPLFEISKKYNTQMICLSDLKEHTIYDRFNLIYSLSIEREVGREEEYIEQKTVKKDIRSDEEEMVYASLFKIDDMSRFEMVN